MAAARPIQDSSNPRISNTNQRESDGNEDEEPEDQDDEPDTDPIEPVSGQVHMVPSVFGPNRAPTVYFEYPPDLNIKRQGICQTQDLSARKLVYYTNWERNCVKNAFARAGFERCKSMNGSWNGYWGKHPNTTEYSRMNRFQKVNHFPGSWCIGRKDRLARTILAFQRKAGGQGQFDFHPDVLHLPFDRRMLELKIKQDKKSLWIIKPQASSCGRGIRVISKDNLDTIPMNKKAIIQKYIEKPHLINGHKYDLRLYVLVTSCDPLKIYLFEKGLVRFCANKYSTKHIKSKYTHLTNYSINKKSDKFVEPCDDKEVDEEALKWSLESYWKHMEGLVGGEQLASIKENIKNVIVKTMIAAESDISPGIARVNRTKGICYELFGFDIILDSAFKPWLLEVNVSPSLMGSSPLDRTIKGTLMADVFHLVGFQPYDDQAIRRDEKREATNKLRGVSDGRHKAALSRRQDSWRRTMSCEAIELKELSKDDWDVIYDTVDENQRRGHFERIYPTAARCKEFLPLFIAPRFNDVLLHRMVSDRNIWNQSPLGPPQTLANSGRIGTRNHSHTNGSTSSSSSSSSSSVNSKQHPHTSPRYSPRSEVSSEVSASSPRRQPMTRQSSSSSSSSSSTTMETGGGVGGRNQAGDKSPSSRGLSQEEKDRARLVRHGYGSRLRQDRSSSHQQPPSSSSVVSSHTTQSSNQHSSYSLQQQYPYSSSQEQQRPSSAHSNSSEPMANSLMMKVPTPGSSPPTHPNSNYHNSNGSSNNGSQNGGSFKMHAMKSPSYKERSQIIEEDNEIIRLEKAIRQSEGKRHSHLKIPEPVPRITIGNNFDSLPPSVPSPGPGSPHRRNVNNNNTSSSSHVSGSGGGGLAAFRNEFTDMHTKSIRNRQGGSINFHQQGTSGSTSSQFVVREPNSMVVAYSTKHSAYATGGFVGRR